MFNTSPTNSYTTRKAYIDAWGEYVSNKLDRGWTGYLITLTFKHIPGSERTRLRVMEGELERVYATLLTRLVRHPHAARNAGRLPIWIFAPDYPVAKHEKKLLAEVTVNDGLHLHGVGLFENERRLGCTVEEHFEEKRHIYIHGDHPLYWIEITPIEYEERYVVSYGFKSVKRRREVGVDGFMILPRSPSEMREFI